MAWIYQRGQTWWLGDRSSAGELIQQSLKTKVESEARAVLDKLKLVEQAHTARMITADFISAVTGKTIERKKTAAEYLDAWLANATARVRPGTAIIYRRTIREFKIHLKADASPLLFEDITPEMIRAFWTARLKTAAVSTLKTSHAILASVFIQAHNEGQITKNPLALAALPKRTAKSKKRPLTISEVKKLYDEAKPFWKWMIRVGYGLGLSLGDAITLQAENVNLRRREVKINRRKSGREVTIPIGTNLVALFKETWPPSGGYFWPKEAKHYLGPSAANFSRGFRKLMADCGIEAPGLGFHCLRHTFVTNLKIAGAVDSVAKELAGHGSSAVSAIYTHLPAETLAEAVRRMPDF
jgi:integrase